MLQDNTEEKFILNGILITLNKMLVLMPTKKLNKQDKELLKELNKSELKLAKKVKTYYKAKQKSEKDPFGAISELFK